MRFAHFPTVTLGGNWIVQAQPDAGARLRELLGLAMANYGFDPVLCPQESVAALLSVLEKQGVLSVNAALAAAGQANPAGLRALMWPWKFDLVRVWPGA